MRHALVMLTVLGASLFIGATSARAGSVPRRINFQAQILDKVSDLPLPDGTVDVVFNIYDVSTNGTALWGPETHAGVTITDGFISVVVGSVTALSLPFDTEYWLGVEVDTDGEMLPRFRLAAAPYAVRAATAETADDATTVGGNAPSAFATSTHSHDAEYVNTAAAGDTMNGKLTISPASGDALELTTGGIVFSDASTLSSAPPNQAPVVLVTAARQSFSVSSVTVNFDATSSYDPEAATPLTYEWDFTGNGTFASNTSTPSFTYSVPYRSFLPAVRVTDPAGRTAEGKVLVWTGDIAQQINNLGARENTVAEIEGRPAVAYAEYYDSMYYRLMFAINANADGSGAWSIYTVDDGGGGATMGFFSSMIEVDNKPAIAYQNSSGVTYFAILTTQSTYGDGDTFWTITEIATNSTNYGCSLAFADGRPIIAYHCFGGTEYELWVARNASANGMGAWSKYQVDWEAAVSVGQYPSIAEVSSRPAIAYRRGGMLYYTILNVAGTYGTTADWATPIEVDAGDAGEHSISLAVVNGMPAILYKEYLPADMRSDQKYAYAGVADGTGSWARYTIEQDILGGMAMTGTQTALIASGGLPVVSYSVADEPGRYATCNIANGSGTWNIQSVVSEVSGQFSDLSLVNGKIAYSFDTGNWSGMSAGPGPVKFVLEP